MSISNSAVTGVMVGVDVGKYRFESHIEDQTSTRSFENTLAGFIAFEDTLPDDLAWVVLEATGGYEQPLKRYLRQCGYRVHVAHPVRVRAFATAHGVLAKTDPIDAAVLSAYGRSVALFEVPAETAERERIQSLIRRRTQLVEQRKAEANRLDKTIESLVIDSIQRHLSYLDAELESLSTELEALLDEHEAMRSQVELYESVRGVGRQTALTLLADLPELGHSNDKSLTALVGLAPYARDSSTLKKHRRIRGGRCTVRRVLYMAALSAIRYNEPIKSFYHRLRQRGKPGKVAIIAVMRKLLLVLNAIARRQTPWIDHPANVVT